MLRKTLLITMVCLLCSQTSSLIADPPDRGQLREFLIPRDHIAGQVLHGWAEEGDLLQCNRRYVVHPDYYVRDIKVTHQGDSVSTVTVVGTTQPGAGVGVGRISAFLLAEKDGVSPTKFLPVVGLPKEDAVRKPQQSGVVNYRFLIIKRGEEQKPCNADKIEYRARRVGNTVFLSAKGVHPTSGFRVLFNEQPGSTPTFRLMQIRPTGAVTQVLTPFELCTAYEESTNMRSVTVFDAAGEHSVAIHDPG